jgi:hypothetical protein
MGWPGSMTSILRFTFSFPRGSPCLLSPTEVHRRPPNSTCTGLRAFEEVSVDLSGFITCLKFVGVRRSSSEFVKSGPS